MPTLVPIKKKPKIRTPDITVSDIYWTFKIVTPHIEDFADWLFSPKSGMFGPDNIDELRDELDCRGTDRWLEYNYWTDPSEPHFEVKCPDPSEKDVIAPVFQKFYGKYEEWVAENYPDDDELR